MDYELTQHAKDALVKRLIPVDWLERVLTAPERTEPDGIDATLEHRLASISEHDNRVLRVIINTQTSPMKVATLFFDRKMRGAL